MGLTLTLTDMELPASPAFIEFLYAALKGEDYHVGEWYAQEEEGLAVNKGRFNDIQAKAKFVLSDDNGQKLIVKSYRYFKEMLTGKPNNINILKKYKFYFVVGIPRTGGTYLTKQLFRACNINYKRVQNALAHDGFPHLAHLSFKKGGNVSTNGLLQLAEYLVMVEIFFQKHGQLKHEGSIIVPKKFTKVIYNYPLLKELFSDNSVYILTLRHPLSMIQSVLEKSGGMPEGRKYALRSAIERWALDDWVHFGAKEKDVREMDYVSVFLGYWKRFHYQMALAGIPAKKDTIIVPYGQEYMTSATLNLYKEFGTNLEPEEFKVANPPIFHKEEEEMAEKVVSDVSSFWSSLDLKFPEKEIRNKY